MARAAAAALAATALTAGLIVAAPPASAVVGASGPVPSQPDKVRAAAARPAKDVGDPAVGRRAVQAPVTVTVRFRHGAARTAVGRLVAAGSGRASRQIAALDVVSYAVPAADAASLLARLRSRSDVVTAGFAVERRLADVPDDPRYADQAPDLLAGHVPTAWDVTHGSSSVRIAVVDSGMTTTHEDLDGGSAGSKVVGRYNATDGGTDVTDTIGHGTFVAGVAAAQTNNGLGVAGVGRDTSLLAVKVANSSGSIMSDAVANGIVWATDHGARIINLSLGSETPDPTEKAAVEYAQSNDVLVVAAAGNDGNGANAVNYPAGYPGVVAVGATDTSTGHRASFSEHGGFVTLAAPGVQLWSTTAGGSYAQESGTSFASPYVAGAAALLAAYSPTSTALQLRSALVSSAHGFVGEGLGAGQVDAAAALARLAPPTIPALTAPSGTVSGVVDIAATSTAAKVRFAVDGVALGAPVAVVGGQATTSWSSFGRSGAHAVTAVDCNATGVCSSRTDSVTVTVANEAPVVTAPATDDSVSGAYVVSATAPGGGVRFYVDGASVAFAPAAPYTANVFTSLPDGPHTVTARQCDVTGTVCQGAASDGVAFSSKSLHPVLVSVLPSPFSPNGDRRKDTATVVYSLPDSEAVVARVYDANGTRVLGPLSWGVLPRGTHSFVVRGTTSTGSRWADGVYTVVLSTTATVAGVPLRGAANRAFRVDSTAPALTGITGNGTGFFPYPDGYRDAFAPLVTTNEGATLSLVIRSRAGSVVRTVSVTKSTAGRYVVAWNGRDARGSLVPAGWYYWRYQALDRAGNLRVTRWYTVKVSLARLQARSAVLRVAGSRATVYGGSAPDCSGGSQADSDYATGLWLINQCDSSTTGSQLAAAFYNVALPAATSYSAIYVRAYGYSYYTPSWVEGRLRNTASGMYDRTGVLKLATSTTALWSFGGLTAANHVSGRVATVAIDVPNNYGSTPPYDFDIAYVELVVNYKVLA